MPQCGIGCERHARAKSIKKDHVNVHLRDKHKASEMKLLHIISLLDNDVRRESWDVLCVINRKKIFGFSSLTGNHWWFPEALLPSLFVEGVWLYMPPQDYVFNPRL